MHTTRMHADELELIKRALMEYESRFLADWQEVSAMTGPAGVRAMVLVNYELDCIQSIQHNLWAAGGLAYVQEELPR